MRKYIIYIILILSLFSCEEAIEWEQKGEFTPRLVVDAMITNKAGYNYVKLTLPVSQSGEVPNIVSGANVAVRTDETDFVLFTEDPINPGYYSPESNIRGVVNQFYLLYIAKDQYEFYATAAMIPVVPLSDIQYYEDQQNPGNYRIIFPESNNPSMIRYIADFTDFSTGTSQQSVFYNYNLSTVDVNEFFKPAKESLSFPANTRIIRMKYSLAPDHERYIRSLLSETEWKGGWFDVMPGNLHTNLSAGGVGYFGASSLVIDTVFFE
ncbi:MAG: DUF4249 family protein [Bacteroidales bacterium]|nr:DUF4249 family protein [Bacteroidales bacterium]